MIFDNTLTEQQIVENFIKIMNISLIKEIIYGFN